MSKTKPKLIIIDGNALIHRSFHALPPTLRTKKGVLVNAVYGFTSFLLKALNEFHPEYVVLTLDKKGPTFRHEAYTEYKATRVKAPDELYEQIPLVKKVAEAFNIPIFELSGFEADDLIGTICEKTKKEKNLEKIIITGDLDTLQLIDNQTKVYTMSRGLSDSVLYGAEEVRARYSLNPDQIIDYKALRGDVSDNIPGVKGIGEKTASELLVEFKTLDGVYTAAEKNSAKIKPRIIELLKEHKDSAYLSQSLATIHLEAPLKFSLRDISFTSFKLENVMEVFSEFEFKSLLIKVKDLRDNINKAHDRQESSSAKTNSKETENQGDGQKSGELKFVRNAKKFNYQLVDDDKKFSSFLKKLKIQKEFALDTETSGLDPITAELIGISFSWKEGEAYFIIINKNRLSELKPILENTKIKKFGHNLKFDWRVLKNQGVELNGLNFDTMIASYLLNPGNRQHNLDSIVFTELGFEKISKSNLASTQPAQLSIDFKALDPEKLSLYSCEDADFTNRLVKILSKRLKTEGLSDLFNRLEMPLVAILGEVENNGIILDLEPLKLLDKEVGGKLAQLEKNIHKLAKVKFNINSTKQLKEVLFEKLAIPTDNIKKTKTGFSTAEDELEKLNDLHPIIPQLRDYRELNKLQTTYLNALPTMVNAKTGRIHTNFNQTVAATGRLSSNDPNLQNIPTRTEEGRKVRAAFVAAPGFRLIGFDYSQIELRLAAHISGDKKMISAFKNKEDIHTATAAEINGVKLSEVAKNMRREAKAINFGILYGQGPHGLSQSAGIPYWQANEFIKKYWEVYPSVKKMIDSSIKEARKNSYAITLFGRKRPLPEINSSIPMIRKSAERMAINTPLQGTAADLIKMAMIKVEELIKGQEDDIRMLLQIHDELIFEIKKDKISFYSPKIRDIMQDVLKLRVPIIVDESIGDNWGELK
ncbi:MAG: DNA polymerase I [Candidatus Falkowbacteria bacterium]